MIIHFSVENFRSFKTAQRMTFKALPDLAHRATHCVSTQIRSVPRLVRFAILVGPNAAGKSSFLSALRILRELVVHSGTHTASDFAKLFTPYYGETNTALPTIFSIDVLLDAVRYQYSIAYNDARIVFEELHASITKKPQRWYSRQFNEKTQRESWALFSPGLHGPRSVWKNATGPQSLMLTTAARLDSTQLQPLLAWFEDKLAVDVDSEMPDMRPFALKLRDLDFKARTLRILAAVDIPALDVRSNESTVLPGTPVKIEFLCGRCAMRTVWLGAKSFSSGAHQLVRLIAHLVNGSPQDRFVAIDEFDTHLHPSVTRGLLQSITESTFNRHLQMLVITHSTALLDLDIMRRDEIWLMSAGSDDGSHLARLPDYSPRRGESIARAYMRGRYDSLPAVRGSLLRENLKT